MQAAGEEGEGEGDGEGGGAGGRADEVRLLFLRPLSPLSSEAVRGPAGE